MACIRVFCFLLLLIFTNFTVQAQELLKPDDVSKIMKQIMTQHVDQKQMTGKILENSFKVYIDQFDPDRIYLLESEVYPYLHMTPDQTNELLEQYKNKDFSVYYKLNDLIQNAIVRSRELRAPALNNPLVELQDVKPVDTNNTNGAELLDPDLKRVFAKTIPELQYRIKQDMVFFIKAERNRYGDNPVTRDTARLLSYFERRLKNQESHYLYTDPSGQPVAADEKENMFIIHVLKSLASSLDAHTSFFDNSEAFDMKLRLEKGFTGVGVVLQQVSGAIVVSRIIDGSPAAKTGLIKPNDKLIAIDDKPISNESFDKVVELMNGRQGSSIKIGVERKGTNGPQMIDATLVRETVTVNEDRASASYVKVNDGIIGKITLNSFYQGANGVSSEKDVRDAIKKLDKEGKMRGLILDLRENGGGFLMQAVKVAGLFITNGVIVISKYSTGEEKFYRDMDGQTLYQGPLIVLTSKATASAAEIVTQALQDYGVAVVVGDEQTYGKGTIQSQTVTNHKGNSSYFKVTVGKYYTVSGKTPQIQGVKSDVVVPSEFSNEQLGEAYLNNSLKPDNIEPEYNDDLQDISADLKPWYLHYYMPTIQHQTDYWKKAIPTLKQNSRQRLARNFEYQRLLDPKLMDQYAMQNPRVQMRNAMANVDKAIEDQQMNEAVNIMRDMITIYSQERPYSITADK